MTTPRPGSRFELVEKCSCESEFSVVDDKLIVDYSAHMKALREWRKQHNHDIEGKNRRRATRGPSALGFQQYNYPVDDDDDTTD